MTKSSIITVLDKLPPEMWWLSTPTPDMVSVSLTKDECLALQRTIHAWLHIQTTFAYAQQIVEGA